MDALKRQKALQCSSAPYIVIHPLVCMWRSNGIVASLNESSVMPASRHL